MVCNIQSLGYASMSPVKGGFKIKCFLFTKLLLHARNEYFERLGVFPTLPPRPFFMLAFFASHMFAGRSKRK